MPTRMLHEKICDSATLAELSSDEERLFHRLVVKADDYGRFHADPKLILGACLPLFVDKIEVSTVRMWRDRLADAGLIDLYVVEGREYLQLVTWGRYQRQRGSNPKFPPPLEGAETCGESPQGAEISGSRVVKTGGRKTLTGRRKTEDEGRGPARAQARGTALANETDAPDLHRAKTPPPDHLEPTSSEYRLGETVGLSRGQVDAMAEAMLDHYRATGEHRVDWHSTLRGWIRKAPMYDQDARTRSEPVPSNGTGGMYGEIVTVEGIRT